MTQRSFTPPPTRFGPRQAQRKAVAAPAGPARVFVPPPIPQRAAAQAKGSKPGRPTRSVPSTPKAGRNAPWKLAPPAPQARAIQRAEAAIADPEVIVTPPATSAQAAALAARGVALRMAASDVERLAKTLGMEDIHAAVKARLDAGTVYAAFLRTHFRACVTFYQYASDATQALDRVLAGSVGGERVARFTAFIRALEDDTDAAQIVHPDDYAAFAADTSRLRERLRGLRDVVSLAAGLAASPAKIVEHLLDHDKSYLVCVGAIDGLMADMQRGAVDEDPVATFLDGRTNLHTVSQLMVAVASRRAHLAQYAAHLPALDADWSNAAYYRMDAKQAEARPFKNFRLMMQELMGPMMMKLQIADEREIVTTRLAALKAAYPMLPAGYFDKLREQLDNVFPP
jgi:hypothetical protein